MPAEFQQPGTHLLPISIWIPALAGIVQVASRPDHWKAGSALGCFGLRLPKISSGLTQAG